MKPNGDKANILAWDLPARICHWGFALSMTAALIIGFRFHPKSEVFQYHMLLGIYASWFLAVRIILGFVGSGLSRWPAFFHSPRRTLAYFIDVACWRISEPAGLNPGTAVFAFAIYLSLVALNASGFMQDWSETFHGCLARGVVVLIACHLLGLALHAVRHRECTFLAMVHGKKKASGGEAEIKAKGRIIFGLVLLVVSAVTAWIAGRNFDPSTSILHLPWLPALEFPLIQKG
jgi:cytochrome b